MTRLSPVPPKAAAPVFVPQDRPVYRIKEGKFFGPDDTMRYEGDLVVWRDEPNLEMEPMNDLAQKAMLAYLEKLDECGRKVAEKTGKNYNSLADAHTNAMALATQESKQFEVLSGPKQIPLMGARKEGKTVETVQVDVKPATVLSEPKTKLVLGKGQMVDKD